MPNNIGWAFVVAGILIALFGILWLAGGASWIGRLPGDIRIENENTRFYFPLATCVVLSVAGSLLMWLVRLFRS